MARSSTDWHRRAQLKRAAQGFRPPLQTPEEERRSILSDANFWRATRELRNHGGRPHTIRERQSRSLHGRNKPVSVAPLKFMSGSE
jgi:hypothetical protein